MASSGACRYGQFELSVKPATNALDAFEHPYVCRVAWPGVDYRLAALRDTA
jgi:hypothetical protein